MIKRYCENDEGQKMILKKRKKINRFIFVSWCAINITSLQSNIIHILPSYANALLTPHSSILFFVPSGHSQVVAARDQE